MLVPEYNQTLNRLAVYLVALNPIAKYGLTLNPVMLSWQISLFGNNENRLLKWIGVLITSCCIVWLSYVFPHFDRVMGILGAFFSFFISGIFPLVCHQKLFQLPRWQKVLDYSLLVIGICMAITGTLAALFKQKIPS
jgi:vesicular inhibitory amino acid transporter